MVYFHFHSLIISICIVGHVCDALSVGPISRCCPEKGDKFSCQWVFLNQIFKLLRYHPYEEHITRLEHSFYKLRGCNLLSQCCNSYEYCVSCCLNPSTVIFSLLVFILFSLVKFNSLVPFFIPLNKMCYWGIYPADTEATCTEDESCKTSYCR